MTQRGDPDLEAGAGERAAARRVTSHEHCCSCRSLGFLTWDVEQKFPGCLASGVWGNPSQDGKKS